jgi:hypothetical protein
MRNPLQILMRSLVMSHTTSLYVMPEVSPLDTCGDRLNPASSVFLDCSGGGRLQLRARRGVTLSVIEIDHLITQRAETIDGNGLANQRIRSQKVGCL